MQSFSLCKEIINTTSNSTSMQFHVFFNFTTIRFQLTCATVVTFQKANNDNTCVLDTQQSNLYDAVVIITRPTKAMFLPTILHCTVLCGDFRWEWPYLSNHSEFWGEKHIGVLLREWANKISLVQERSGCVDVFKTHMLRKWAEWFLN